MNKLIETTKLSNEEKINDQIYIKKYTGGDLLNDNSISTLFPMCWEKLTEMDDLYLKYSDWYKVFCNESGEDQLAALFCVNTNHPEFKIEKDGLEDKDFLHLSEIEIAPSFRNSAYKNGKIVEPSSENNYFKKYINNNGIYGHNVQESEPLKNPNILKNIFNFLDVNARKAGYKVISLMALNNKVESIYDKLGFKKVDLSKYDRYKDNLDWYSLHPFMIKFL